MSEQEIGLVKSVGVEANAIMRVILQQMAQRVEFKQVPTTCYLGPKQIVALSLANTKVPLAVRALPMNGVIVV